MRDFISLFFYCRRLIIMAHQSGLHVLLQSILALNILRQITLYYKHFIIRNFDIPFFFISIHTKGLSKIQNFYLIKVILRTEVCLSSSRSLKCLLIRSLANLTSA